MFALQQSRLFRSASLLLLLALVLFTQPQCSKKETTKKTESKTQVTIQTADGTEMCLIKGGQFTMGFDGRKDSPAHLVGVDSFYIDVHEVTQASFQKLMGSNPSKFGGENCPVERVRWTEAARYCNARSKAENLTPCYDEKTWACNFSANGYRLPTEAEWEYACRAGTKAERFFDGPDARLKRYGWYRENSQDKTHPVKKTWPNPWGLYDMYGNVAEWCNDYYADNYYPTSPKDNPKGPSSGKKRVIRGGSWQSRGKYLNSHHRQKDDPALADVCQGYPIYGFRCVRNAK